MITKLADAGASCKASRPMELALAEAKAARDLGEVPIGAVIVSAAGEVLAQTGNRTLTLRDPTAHAELLAIRGAAAPKGGAVEHGPRFFHQPTCHHAPEVIGGLGETRAGALLKDFFAARR